MDPVRECRRGWGGGGSDVLRHDSWSAASVSPPWRDAVRRSWLLLLVDDDRAATAAKRFNPAAEPYPDDDRTNGGYGLARRDSGVCFVLPPALHGVVRSSEPG